MHADGPQSGLRGLESGLYRRRASVVVAAGSRGCGAFLHRIGFAQVIAMRNNHVRIPMEHALSFATWFWLIVPMSAVVALSLITYLMGK